MTVKAGVAEPLLHGEAEEAIQLNTRLFHWIAGFGLLITPTCPVRDLRDVTLSHASYPDILSR